ncbi:MAG: phosphodiester glycosidase family protein [Gemmatimonadota bacterium]|nr:phosphodiester glycosidase family protein [Gemmatimonadota bacterium]MDH5758527.1 phosphodiester glycosidase family protein [Gemmatimonadota bacterium]
MRKDGVHGGSGAHPGFIVVSMVALSSACAPPDRHPSLEHRLSEAAVELLRPDTVRGARLGAGVWYWYLWSAAGPWAVHVVEADLGRCDLALEVVRAEDREESGSGHELVTSMVSRGGGALAAVNADFFTPEGNAVGTEIVSGVVGTARARPTLSWRPGGAPWMGEARVTGDSVWVGWPVSLRDGDGRTQAVGGFPDLLDGGVRVGDLEVASRPAFAAARHPRTAVAFSPATGRFWMLVVDGRQDPYSVGMTLPELTSLTVALGAVEALNLDGGGSSVMVVGGTARNRPSDPSGERPVVNGLALVRDRSGCH